MIRKLVLATGVFAAVAFASNVQPASATPVGPHTQIPSALETMSPIEQVQYGRSCRRVARICADRWGRGRDFRRCMRRRGC
jgi:hypothetical protein